MTQRRNKDQENKSPKSKSKAPKRETPVVEVTQRPEDAPRSKPTLVTVARRPEDAPRSKPRVAEMPAVEPPIEKTESGSASRDGSGRRDPRRGVMETSNPMLPRKATEALRRSIRKGLKDGFEVRRGNCTSPNAIRRLPRTQSPVAELVPNDICKIDQTCTDPGLAEIVASWDGLPEAIRAGILAMVKAASGMRSD